MLKIFKRNNNNTNEDLQKLLGDYDLPSFSAAVMNTLDLLRDPDASVMKISQQVESDPGLHVQVLKTVNSVAFGLVSKVQNVNHAISLLGNSRLEALVLSLAVKDSLPTSSSSIIDTKKFWRISSIRASLAKKLAMKLHPATSVESFAAGLLQDMAVPVLSEIHGQSYNNILEKWGNEEGYDLTDLEKDQYGYDHSMAGSLLARKWNLPQHIDSAISGHHSETDNEMVEPAVRLVSKIKYDFSDDFSVFKDICISAYGLDASTIEDFIQSALNDSEELL